MHGTYLNGEKVDRDVPRCLNTGDILVFGMGVYRNQQTFQPAEVKVDIEFRSG